MTEPQATTFGPNVVIYIGMAGLLVQLAVTLFAMGSFKGSVRTELEGTNARIDDMNENLGRRIDEVREGQKSLDVRVGEAEKEIARIDGKMNGHLDAAAKVALFKIRAGREGAINE